VWQERSRVIWSKEGGQWSKQPGERHILRLIFLLSNFFHTFHIDPTCMFMSLLFCDSVQGGFPFLDQYAD
jgi:hypothetical protein